MNSFFLQLPVMFKISIRSDFNPIQDGPFGAAHGWWGWFEGYYWFEFNNLGMALGMSLQFSTRVAKGSKLKFRKILGLIPTFVEVAGEKLVEGAFCSCHPK